MTTKQNIALLLIAIALFTLISLHFINHAPDDVFISLRYAQNFSQGHGLVFNPGERVEGYSNFLWTLLMAVLAGSMDKEGLVFAAKFISIICGLFALLVVAWIAKAKSCSDDSKTLWGLAPLGFAGFGYAAFWSAAGMETGFYLLLVSLSIALYFLWLEKDSYVFAALSALTFVAVALTRPEGVIFFVAAIGAEFFRRHFGPKGATSRHLIWVGTFICLYVAFFLWRHSYYGAWWPNTFYAKAGGGIAKYAEGVRYLLLGLPALFWSNPIILAILALPFCFKETRNAKVVFLGLCVAAQVAFAFYAGGDWMEGYRFLVPAMPAVALLLPGSIALVQKRLASAALPIAAKAVLIVILCGCAVIHLYNVKQVRHDPSGLQEYQGANFFKPDHLAVANFLKSNAQQGDLVALGEAGLIPYLTDLPALDLFGLMDAHLARTPGMRHQKLDNDYVFSKQPKFIILGGMKIWSDQVTSDFAYARSLLEDPRLKQNYERAMAHHTFLVYQAK